MIKQILIILVGTFYTQCAMAEYNGYHVNFEIETKAGETIDAYTYVVHYAPNADSLENTDYLTPFLGAGLWNYEDSLMLKYAQTRIKYEFSPTWGEEGEKSFIFSLSDLTSIKRSDIKSIRVKEVTDYTYAVNIANELSLSDSVWITKPPIKSYNFGGYLCFSQVFVHEMTKENAAILKKLELKQAEIDAYYKRLEAGELYDTEFEDEEQFDEDIAELIALLDLDRLVIIEECTC